MQLTIVVSEDGCFDDNEDSDSHSKYNDADDGDDDSYWCDRTFEKSSKVTWKNKNIWNKN